jgi:putative transposase
VIPGLTHHVIQRGTNRSDIFRAASDFEALLISLLRASREYELDIHSYTLMTNHFHLVVTPRTANAMSEAMRSASVSYVRYFNRKYIRTGTLFESRYRSFVIDTEEYWFTCMRYVELNPVRAGLVHSCGAYRWSSYAANALGRRDPLITPHQLYLSLGDSDGVRQQHWRKICGHDLTAEELTDIRDASNRGGSLGRSDRDSARVGKAVIPTI